MIKKFTDEEIKKRYASMQGTLCMFQEVADMAALENAAEGLDVDLVHKLLMKGVDPDSTYFGTQDALDAGCRSRAPSTSYDVTEFRS